MNTGWVGASVAQGGKRCSLKYTRAILDAIHSGELSKVEYEKFPVFNLNVPKSCPGVPSEILNPTKAWTGGQESFQKEIESLGKKFNDNFVKYSDQATAEVQEAGPTV